MSLCQSDKLWKWRWILIFFILSSDWKQQFNSNARFKVQLNLKWPALKNLNCAAYSISLSIDKPFLLRSLQSKCPIRNSNHDRTLVFELKSDLLDPYCETVFLSGFLTKFSRQLRLNSPSLSHSIQSSCLCSCSIENLETIEWYFCILQLKIDFLWDQNSGKASKP